MAARLITVTVRIRWWQLWALVARMAWSHVTVRPRLLKPALWLWLCYRLLVSKRRLKLDS